MDVALLAFIAIFASKVCFSKACFTQSQRLRAYQRIAEQQRVPFTMESTPGKLERKLAKVETRRRALRLLCGCQVLFGVAFVVYVHWGAHGASAVTHYFAAVGATWAFVGALGVVAMVARRVPMLALFCGLELFCTLITACANSVLLVIDHLQCSPRRAVAAPVAAAAAASDTEHAEPWLACDSAMASVAIVVSAAMVLYLGATAAAGLALRYRIQKTGKRNLDWNQKPQRWKERNVRRGVSAALRSLTGSEKAGDEDSRLKYLATRDKKYNERSLMVRFATVEGGARKGLVLHLRKGYLKHGDAFGTKIYLSQIQAITLHECAADADGAVDDDDAAAAAAAAIDDDVEAARYGAERYADDAPPSERLTPPSQRRVGPVTACLRWLRRCGARAGADGYDGERVYRLRVRAQQHLGWRLKRIFGLALHEQSVYFDFGSDDERQRLLSFLTPLLPLTVTVRHKAAGGAAPLSPLQLGGGGGGSGSGDDDGAGVGLRRRSVSSSSEGSASASAPTTEVLSLFVGSWNMGDAPAPASLDAWLPRDAHDVYVVATQEGSDEHWPMAVESHLGSSYVKVSERRMGGIQLLLFTHRYAAPQPPPARRHSPLAPPRGRTGATARPPRALRRRA